ncbi:MAG: cadherin-like domain-containing protein, partial [Saprospiraceae bacterium]|nr:cadherin-like domain-containing protein [Saprospiraceae bacterium]
IVYLVINPDNDPPIAIFDKDTTTEDTPVDIDVIANDSDLDGNIDPATVVVTDPPNNGSTSVNPTTGEITYTPDPNFTGLDTLIYSVCDDGTPLPSQCDTAIVYLVINPDNDPPIAIFDRDTTTEDTPVDIDVIANDSDIDGNIDPATVVVTDPPSNGTTSVNTTTGEITYTPDPNFNGLDTLIYTVCDDGTPLPSQCDTAIVYLVIDPSNDPPIAIFDRDTTLEDTPVDIDVIANDSDLDGNIDPATVVVTDLPSNGSTSVNTITGEITYTPDPNFNGLDTLIYTVCDDGTPLPSQCDTAIVFLVIDPVNDPPTQGNETVSTQVDTPILNIDVDDNNSDPEGDPLTVNPPSMSNQGGTVTDNGDGTINYVPPIGYAGLDTIIYTVCDPQLACVTDTVFIDITDGCVKIETSVWLEGSYQTANDSMYTILNDLGYLPGQDPFTFLGIETPAGQPYNTAPFDHFGTEGDAFDYNLTGTADAGYPATVTDWVLVSLRTGTGKETTVCKRAGLLFSDGHIEFPDEGNWCCSIDANSTYYLVIEHRNHLIVMSHVKIPVTNNTIAYDFRIQESYRGLLGFGQKEIEPGVFVMYGGNGEQLLTLSSDTDINVKDKDDWLDSNGINHSSYYKDDFDMNGDVNVQDKSLWLENNGTFSDVPNEN